MPDTPKNAVKAPDSSQDPIKAMAEILKDSDLTAEDKQLLYDLSKTRFKHRRQMAYIALFGMFVVAGVSAVPDIDIDTNWLYPTLAAIVGAYYGVSAIRPNS